MRTSPTSHSSPRSQNPAAHLILFDGSPVLLDGASVLRDLARHVVAHGGQLEVRVLRKLLQYDQRRQQPVPLYHLQNLTHLPRESGEGELTSR